MSRQQDSELRTHPLRIPDRAKERIRELAGELRENGAELTAAEVARGLCLLGLRAALGDAGQVAADAFRTAAALPTEQGVARGVLKLVASLDAEQATKAPRSEGGLIKELRAKWGRSLQNQALRLPELACSQVAELTREIGARKGTPGGTVRGLCMLALELIDARAGLEVAKPFRAAGVDPSPKGIEHAAFALRLAVERAPSTTPDPHPPVPEPAELPADTPPPATLPSSFSAWDQEDAPRAVRLVSQAITLVSIGAIPPIRDLRDPRGDNPGVVRAPARCSDASPAENSRCTSKSDRPTFVHRCQPEPPSSGSRRSSR